MQSSKCLYYCNLLKSCLSGIFFLTLLFITEDDLSGQQTVKRPSVGLVLSGGGSHGIAHLGVLKVMEEAGLRPDFITGVSMGSIIGGMYSIGYSTDSLQKLINSINWDIALSNKIPEYKIVFQEKKHFYNSFISLGLSLKKIRLPSGLINGQMIESTLSFYAWPAADIRDFNKLPVPFMCIATDIITFKKTDLKTGYLPDAIRASIAIPSLLTPIKIDTSLLLDGGMVRNFAASEVKDMGADIVIGSYVGFHRYKEEDLLTVPVIMKQFGFSRSLDDFEEQKKLVDLLIIPNLTDISTLDFRNPDSLILKGYIAALPFKKYFMKLADSLNNYHSQLPLVNILDKQFYTFDKIEVIGNDITTEEQILGVLDINPGDKIDKYLIRDRIDLLYGKAWFEKVKYRFMPRNDSLILIIDCIEKPRTILYGSAHYDNSLLSGILLSISIKNLLSPGSVFDVDSYIGQYYRFRANMMQFLDRHHQYGLAASFYSDNTLIPKLKMLNEDMGVYSRTFSPSLSLSSRLGMNYLLSFTTTFDNMYLTPHNLTDVSLRYIAYDYLSFTVDYQANTLNSKYFPDKGINLNVSAGVSDLLSGTIKTDSSKVNYTELNQGGFSFDRFFTFSGSIRYYFSTSPRLTLAIGGNALIITNSFPGTEQNNFYLLGGYQSLNKRSIPMVGFHANEIPVKGLATFGAEADWEISRNLHFNLNVNVAAVKEAAYKDTYSALAGYAVGIGYMSVAGPLKVGLMQGFYNNDKLRRGIKGYISLGYNF